ncbi:hypothetical protein [Finegoldia magna]|uniref:hypothetical protein n=1 Tax=Finegoldia magna TaxID=1260 RepID=UPI0029011C43|nr:hypothetical protein [Finegoldia magna]MDU1213139.1 hypothetical protein [Finegoldia magna]
MFLNRKDYPDEKKEFLYIGTKKPNDINIIKELYEEISNEFYFKLKDEFIIEISQLNI